MDYPQNPPGRRSSLHDVARCAKVSPSTVSQALNSKGRVSPTTRQRVLEVCRVLRYQPHPTARLLPALRARPGERRLTGLFAFSPVCSEGEPSAYHDFFGGVAQAALGEGRRILYDPLGLGSPLPACSINHFGVDGRLIIGTIDERIVRYYESENIPVVAMGDHTCPAPVWNVTLDRHRAAKLAVEHLWNLGHRRFGLLLQDQDTVYQREFRRGLEDALRERGLPAQSHAEVGSDPAKIHELLCRAEHPTALIAIQVGRALAALEAASGAGLRVPQDLSILLFGRPDQYLGYRAMTHLDPRHEDVGRSSMELMLRLVVQPSASIPTRVLLPPSLFEGATTARAPSS